MLTCSMAGLFTLCVFVSWICKQALSIHLYGQTTYGPLLCSKTYNYHKTGVCKSVVYDIKHISCTLKNITSENLTAIRSSMVTFKQVTMCVPVCGGSCDGLTTASSVTFCRLHGTGMSPLHSSTDAKPNLDNDPTVSLHQACKTGDLCMVQYILSRDLADINCRGKVGRTPVMSASKHGQVKVFDYLVSQGCDMSTEDDYKDTVLHLACEGGNIDIVRNIVMNAKRNVERKGRNGWTAVMRAVLYGHKGVFEFLIGFGGNLTVVSDDGNNILHLACLSGYTDIVEYILSLQVIDIESKGRYERTPVLMAARAGHVAIVKLLLTKGCNRRTVGEDKNNILHLASLSGRVEVVNYILSKQIINIDSRGWSGWTPVMCAVWAGHLAVVKLLSAKGCNMRIVDNKEDNILHVACRGGHVIMVKYVLSKHIADIDSRGWLRRTSVIKAVDLGHLAIVKLLMSKGCNMSAVDETKNNILHVACVRGRVDIVNYILSNHIVDIDSRGRLDMTPAMMAAGRGHVAIVKFLSNRGCSMNVLDEKRENILHVACWYGYIDIVRYIIKLGITNRYQRNINGKTPLQLAKSKNNGNIVRLLQRDM